MSLLFDIKYNQKKSYYILYKNAWLNNGTHNIIIPKCFQQIREDVII